MKFVTKRIHAFLDYPVAIALMALPFLLGLGSASGTPLAFFLSVGTGMAALILTLLTDHHLGAVRVVPYKIHLLVDFLVALVFIAAPFVFSFKGLDAYYYWVNGVAVFLVVSLHKPETAVA